MKKIALLIGLLYTVCFMVSPALAQGRNKIFFANEALRRAFLAKRLENTSCQGPSKIFFANKTFERQDVSAPQASENPCTAKYTLLSSSDVYTHEWAPYAVFYSQLLEDPQEETVLDTLRKILPPEANERLSEKKNSADIVFDYSFVEKQKSRHLLHYVLLRALRQSNQSIRIYKFEMIVPAATHTEDGTPYNASIPKGAYTHFNTVMSKNRASWFKSMRELQIQN